SRPFVLIVAVPPDWPVPAGTSRVPARSALAPANPEPPLGATVSAPHWRSRIVLSQRARKVPPASGRTPSSGADTLSRLRWDSDPAVEDFRSVPFPSIRSRLLLGQWRELSRAPPASPPSAGALPRSIEIGHPPIDGPGPAE